MIGGADIGNDRVVSQLIKAFQIARSRSLKMVTQWYLTYVLQALTDAPHEPLASSLHRHWRHQTLLLLLLASAKRLGEVQDIDMTSTI
jgi:hypothetical protein